MRRFAWLPRWSKIWRDSGEGDHNSPTGHGIARQGVLIQKFRDRLVILNSSHQLVWEIPLPYAGRTADIPWQQVFANLLRKPRSVTHSSFIRMLPQTLQHNATVTDLGQGKERLRALAHWCNVDTIEQIQDAIVLLGTTEAKIEHINSFLGIKYGSRDIPATLQETISPPGTQAEFLLQRYDRLTGVS